MTLHMTISKFFARMTNLIITHFTKKRFVLIIQNIENSQNNTHIAQLENNTHVVSLLQKKKRKISTCK